MPHFVLHVGPHKTGTTYIQRCLDENAAGLSEQGVFVPTQWRDSPENPSHTGFTKLLRQDPAEMLPVFFADLRRSDYRFAVISTETLVGCSEDELRSVRALLEGSTYTIVHYVRRWSELTISSWNELTGQGSSVPFTDCLLDAAFKPGASPAINISIILSRFERVFGKKRLRLVSYDTVLERGGDLFRHFARHHLGDPKWRPPRDRVANPSSGHVFSELRRVLNHIDQSTGAEFSARMAFHLNRRKDDIDLSSILKYINSFTKTLTLEDSPAHIAEVLKSNHSEYSECFTPPILPDRLYSQKRVVAKYVGQEYLIARGVAETLWDLRNELLR